MVEVEKSLIENEAKKMKLDDPEVINCLKNFEFFKVLNEDSKRKLVFIHAKKRASSEKENNEDAVIILEKPHFGSEEIKSYFESDHPTEIYIQNDIYNKLSAFPLKPFNSIFNSIPISIFKYIFCKYAAQGNIKCVHLTSPSRGHYIDTIFVS